MHLADRLIFRLFLNPVVSPWKWPKGAERVEDWEAIQFDGLQGAPMAGLWGAARGAMKGTIVCAHPTHPDVKGFFLRSGHARILRDAGYNVLLFDFNGLGESPRAALRYPLDVLAAGNEAVRRAPGLPVGLLGVCFGAAWGMSALTFEGHPFRAVVAEGPLTSFDSYFTARKAGKLALRERWWRQWLPRTLLQLYRWLHPKWTDQLLPLKVVRSIRNVDGLLVIYGENDSLLPPSIGQQYLDACQATWGPSGENGAPNYALWVVPGARHLQNIGADPKAYRERVVGFFDRVLVGAAPELEHPPAGVASEPAGP